MRTPAAVRRPLLAPTVIGRDEELSVVRSAVEDAAAGRGSTLVVVGEQGVGKSRLLREVRTWCAARGAATLVGRAVDTAVPTPFRPITEALLGALRTASIDDDPDVAPFRGALGRLVPDARGHVAEPAGSLLLLAEGFLRVARSRGRAAGGAAVLLDDLHWADAETMDVVEYLADNLADEPLLLVAAARPTADDAVSRLTGMIDRRVATALPLRRLGTEDTAAMTRSCLGDSAVPAQVLQFILERADGLPFFVEELLAGLRFDGTLARDGGRWVVRPTRRRSSPPTFHGSVRVRVALLAAEHQPLFRDAALLGRRIDPALLATITGTDPASIAEAVRAATELTLVESYESGHRFRHALTRDALLADLPRDELAARSREVLAALRAARPDLPDDLIEVAADLAEAAEDPAAAVGLHLESARRSLTRGALTSAESAQRRALTLAVDRPSRVAATVELVTTLGLSGRAEDVVALGGDLLGAPAPELDGARELAVHVALARAAATVTDWPAAVRHLSAARAVTTGPESTARLDALAAQVALGENRHDDAARLATSAVATADLVGEADLLCESLLVHGRCLRIRSLEQSARSFRRAADVAGAAGLAHREARALAELGFVLGYLGDSSALGTARARARSCGAVETEAVTENALAAGGWFRADVEAVDRHTDAGLVLARRYRLGRLEPALLVSKAAGMALRGETAGMEALLAQAAARGDEPMEVVAALAQGRAACAFATDDLSAAAAHLEAAAAVVAAHPTPAVAPMLALLPLVRAVEGREPPVLDAELRRWNDGASPAFTGLFSAADAVRAGRGDAHAASALMERVLADLEAFPFLAAVSTRLAATAAATDRWGEPARWLDRARATFERLGLPAAAAGCTAARTRPGPRGGPLTGREQEVLALVGAGLPNREIARRLVLSVRTVEKHVERLLAKTGRTNRAQLATYAVRRAQGT